VNIKLGQKVVRAFIEADVPLHLWGFAGIGKSTFLEDLAREMGYHLMDLRLATQEVSDLIGVPKVVEKEIKTITGRDENDNPVVKIERYLATKWAAPDWVIEVYEKAAQGIPTLLFLDEMDRAVREVIQASYQLTLKKMLHEHQLPNTLRIVAAGNPPTDEYMVDTFDVSMCTRWGHVMIDVDADVWLEQFGSKHCHGDINGFIATNPKALRRESAKWDVNTIRTNTPRGIEFMDRLYKVIGPNDKTLLRACLSAVVGSATATQFIDSLDKDWVRLEDILSGKITVPDILQDADGNLKLTRLAYDAMHSLSAEHLELGTKAKKGSAEFKRHRNEREDNFIRFMEDMCSAKKDLVVAIAKTIGTKEPVLLRAMILKSKQLSKTIAGLTADLNRMF